MMETRSIKVVLHDGSVKDCVVEIPTLSPPWKLVFSGIDLNRNEFSGCDLFDAFIALREALEEIGALPLCAGARPDVFPSGMSRSMGGGRKAYVTRIGEPARMADLVDIF